ncbi:hypothetical protein [Marinobacterium arenosum]|uniref:hypothetical protein n=1 Tax=Marinobacterium arenosum TaxID=2862496 RepID=UPI001C982006|nr:hypothetical protein [Marinobacterium arenosum]MBY4676054.1 hypothetical protein [Marinobacterium arenosum]
MASPHRSQAAKRFLLLLTIFILPMVVLLLVPQLALPPAKSAIGSVGTVNSLYNRWLAQYSRSGGDRRLVIPLRYTKGLSSQISQASGQATLDLIGGRLSVNVEGLPEDQPFAVWLVDNRPGPGRSVKPEDGDRILSLGTLTRQPDTWRLEVTLDYPQVKDLEIDLIAVAPANQPLQQGALLFGSPTLFQRLYHGAQAGPVTLLADNPTDIGRDDRAWKGDFHLLVPRPAYAKKGPPPFDQLVADGERLFFEETFDGNGRTCGTCHPADNNFTIDPHFIATLPDDDPLFVSEFMPGMESLEHDRLLRELGLVLENVDGFGNPGVMRGVPGVSALALSMTPEPPGDQAPLARLGWSGDGGAGSGTLREFAIGAIVQHAPLSMGRFAGTDFRLPTEYELDALEAFQLSLGPDAELNLAEMRMRSAIAERGRQLFLQETSDNGTFAAGKCHSCHSNGGANPSALFLAANGFEAGQFNMNLNIGLQRISETLGRMIAPDANPPDEGFGQASNGDGFGDGTFNIPRIVEAADSAPYGHDNSLLTLESFLAFYLSDAFQASPAAAQLSLVDPIPGTQVLTVDNSQLASIAALLRVLNAAENIRQVMASMATLPDIDDPAAHERGLRATLANIDDAIEVLTAAGLHPNAVEALHITREYVVESQGRDRGALRQAIKHAKLAGELLVF